MAGRDTARPFHKIFASYSRQDARIVECCERIMAALGHELLLDTKSLRSGEVWSEGLEGLIREADVFQLFWSHNSMYSPFVEQEWRYALSLQRNYFVRPTYWERPFPEDRSRNLPPPELARLHFHFLGQREELAEDQGWGMAAAEDLPTPEPLGEGTSGPVRLSKKLARVRRPRVHIHNELGPSTKHDTSKLATGSPAEEAETPQQTELQDLLDQIIETTTIEQRDVHAQAIQEHIEKIITEVTREVTKFDQTVTKSIANMIARIDELLAE
ncbi:MAG: TIR domain-containing protein [Sedimentisphaerales bacterium]|nr:TIR domain-containing protein [Sedimentisphaerales bacterium]